MSGLKLLYKHSDALYQQDWGFNIDDMSCRNGFINIHTLPQFKESSSFNEIDFDIENGDIHGCRGSMNIHTLYQHNGLI